MNLTVLYGEADTETRAEVRGPVGKDSVRREEALGAVAEVGLAEAFRHHEVAEHGRSVLVGDTLGGGEGGGRGGRRSVVIWCARVWSKRALVRRGMMQRGGYPDVLRLSLWPRWHGVAQTKGKGQRVLTSPPAARLSSFIFSMDTFQSAAQRSSSASHWRPAIAVFAGVVRRRV